jgi:signal transduction histidine kinase
MMDVTAPPLAPLCRMVLLFRLIAVNVTVFQALGSVDRAPKVLAGLLVASLLSYLPLRFWSTVGPVVAARPMWLGVDLGISLGLYALLGAGSPFFLYTLGTALLGGVLFREAGAIIVSLVLLGGYYALVATGGQVVAGFDSGDPDSLQTWVTLPVLYPLMAAGGAAVRRLVDRQMATELALRSAEGAAAAGAERARVAREMHDSLGKTLYGIALAARALARRVENEAPDAARAARDVSGAAQLAAEEARGLISDLRADTLTLPLGAALAEHVERWSRQTGVAVSARGEDVDLPNPSTRYELFCIAKEALRNVERHAHAESVEVTLVERGEQVVLTIADDGVGIEASGSARELERDGHYGLIGMAERADRVGATVALDGAPGQGTRVIVRVPAGDVRTPEPWSQEEEVVT